jgi:AcrR family transcriptional regulator
MQAIADRSDSSIGALYNYFPDKESVAATLRQQYSEDLQSRVKSLMVQSNNLSAVRFAESFIDCITDFVQGVLLASGLIMDLTYRDHGLPQGSRNMALQALTNWS